MYMQYKNVLVEREREEEEKITSGNFITKLGN